MAPLAKRMRVDPETKRPGWEADAIAFNTKRKEGEFTNDPSRPCPICKCTIIRTVRQKQIRSSDEPMAVFIICKNGDSCKT